jgi:hypothetical protein
MDGGDHQSASRCIHLTSRCGSNEAVWRGPRGRVQHLQRWSAAPGAAAGSPTRYPTLSASAATETSVASAGPSTDIGSVRESDLYNPTRESLVRCVAEANSGRAVDVAMNGHCLSQGLSNRPNGC